MEMIVFLWLGNMSSIKDALVPSINVPYPSYVYF